MVYKLIFAENLFISHTSKITGLEHYTILVIQRGSVDNVTWEGPVIKFG